MYLAAQKRFSTILVSIFLVSGFLIFAASGSDAASSEPRTLVIGALSNHPPYERYNSLTRTFEGFNVDILNALADRMGANIDYRQMSTLAGISALRAGRIDGFLGVAYSIERDAYLDFTSPICMISDSIFVRESTKDINSTIDLEGRTVAVHQDDFIGEVLQKGKGIHIVPNVSYATALNMLDRGDVAAFVGSQLTGQYVIKRQRLSNIKIVGSPIYQIGYCIAVQGGNRSLVSEFETALAAIKQTGEYDRISEAWFGEDLKQDRPISRVLLWLAAVVVGIFGFAGWMVNRQLKQKVELGAKELEESQTRFKWKTNEYMSLFEGANDAIFIIRPSDGHFLEVNRKAEELTGYNRTDLLNMAMRDIHRPTDGPRVDKRLDQIVSEGSAAFDDAPMLRKDGSIAHVDISASLIEYSGTKVIQSFLRDVTERRSLEKQVVQAGKLASIGTFTAGLAHEIRNPLNSVNLQLLLLERRIRDGSKDSESESLHLINIVREEVSRLDNLVTEFLFFAKPQNLDCHPCNIHRILDDVFALFHARMAQNGIALERRYVSNLPLLSVDEEKMKQAFINIVQNSIEAMTDGGQLLVSTQVIKKKVIIAIEDTGAGLPEEDINNVFEVFYTSKEKGTGLGLPISLHIVEMHGGTIEIEGKKDRGTVCRISLEVGPAKQQALRREYSLGG